MSSATNIDEEIFAKRGDYKRQKGGGDGIRKGGFIDRTSASGDTTGRSRIRVRVQLHSQQLFRKELHLETPEAGEEGKEEFVLESDQKTFLSIPKELLDGDLLKVSFYYPRDARNTKVCVVDGEPCEGYDLILYNWKDVNGDGKFASDEFIPNEAQKANSNP